MINLCFAAKVKDCPDVCNCLGTYVDCASNKLSKIPPNIPKWANVLTLQNNSIKRISDFNWKQYTELRELILNKNNIANIPNDVLQHSTQLKVLILDYNHLRVISKTWLYGLDSLKQLSLSHNVINKIDLDAWEFCQTLYVLDLSFNNLESIEADTFKNLGQLQKLSLNNNNITYIKENAFVHLPKLKVLNLSNNQISWTIEDANGVFQGLNDLLKFHLAGNQIKSINVDAFIGLKNVTYLNLANNNITSIQNNAFSKLSSLKDLVINTTSLLCDCNLRWFVDWLHLKQMKLHATICAYPDGLRGQSLIEVSKNLTCDESPKLRLIEEPEPEIMALKGENITLNCKAISSSHDIMTFLWKKDNIELVNSNLVIKSYTEPDGKSTVTRSELNLINVDHSDAGKYQCVVSNSFGTTYSQKSAISVLVYPTFVKIPKNITVRAGEMVRLECAANGEPTPEIAWHKDGGNDFPAARERRMQVMPHDDVFFIVNAKPIDMGVYSCTAHNLAGTVVANASLTIQEKPSFIKAMEDKEFTAGEDMVLPCLAKGLPKPTITWLKDGEAIIRTERHFFIHEDQLLIIVDSVKADSGVYECRLKKSSRRGERTKQDHRETKYIIFISHHQCWASSTYDTSNMMGIIIITVVCCAVLTSIIWVVIIYQTRKRIPPPVIQTEMQELPDMTDKSRTHQLQLQLCPDNISNHSSSKDSGTGDSAKHSNDDLVPEEFTMIVNGEIVMDVNNSHIPLLHYPRSTNHDRIISMETSASDVEPKDV
ncbi:hypothetical protein NQ315_010249 [Exocentrus adspersus]|uniref:Ig-like domain-containing protein n=1 Tax=Exocentrus adspersus TaxID=1586481 RepID=A0AAV8WB25_9CUCU|nr:hypothetical protein NQ315_010249 [Exocentrus adspersus]